MIRDPVLLQPDFPLPGCHELLRLHASLSRRAKSDLTDLQTSVDVRCSENLAQGPRSTLLLVPPMGRALAPAGHASPHVPALVCSGTARAGQSASPNRRLGKYQRVRARRSKTDLSIVVIEPVEVRVVNDSSASDDRKLTPQVVLDARSFKRLESSSIFNFVTTSAESLNHDRYN
jgi:hypothetical protein